MKSIRFSILIAVLIILSVQKLLQHEKFMQHDLISNIQGNINISNLDASNWMLGELTLQQYYAKRFQISARYSTSLCPISTPFVFNGKTTCAQCPSDTPIFSLQTDSCVACPQGENYSSKLNQCLSQDSSLPENPPATTVSNKLTDITLFKNITNLDANNWVLGNLTLNDYYQKRFNITKNANTNLCPIQLPFVAAGKQVCSKCPIDAPIFSLQTDTCIPCKVGEVFNNISKQCEDPKAAQVTKSSDSTNNISNLAVVSSFDNVSNLDAGNWVLGTLTLDDYYKIRFNKTLKQGTSLCPLSTPYVFDGQTICRQCPQQTPIFSLETNKCILCPDNETYNSALNQCQDPAFKPATPIVKQNPLPQKLANPSNYTNITNLDGANWILGNITLEEYYQRRFQITRNFSISLCPIQTPYVLKGKTTCQQCPIATPIFCLENQTCLGCQNGQIYDSVSKQCKNPNFTPPQVPNKNGTTPSPIVNISKFANITNFNGPNWILGDMTQQQFNVKRFKQTVIQNTAQCDIKTPYVIKGHGGICQQCPKDKPIFVVSNQTCIGCQIGQEWNQTLLKCTNITDDSQLPRKNGTDTKVSQTNSSSSMDFCSGYQNCQPFQFFNFQTNKCQKCEAGQYFDIDFQACLFCPESAPLLDKNWRCVACPVGLRIDRRRNECK